MQSSETTIARSEERVSTDRMPTGIPLRVMPMFFFIHVQKTAGSSLNFALSRMFGRYATFHQSIVERAGGEDKIRALLERTPDFYDDRLLIVGHIRFQHPLVQMTNRRKIVLAVMREPIARITSLYDFIRRRPDHVTHAALRDLTLCQAIRQHSPFRANAMNTQLRLIFGTPEAEAAKRLMRRRNYVIGRFDQLERFLTAVEAITGLKRTEPLPHRNAAPPDVTAQRAVEQPDYEEAVREIEAMNAGDLEFYRSMPPVLVTTASI